MFEVTPSFLVCLPLKERIYIHTEQEFAPYGCKFFSLRRTILEKKFAYPDNIETMQDLSPLQCVLEICADILISNLNVHLIADKMAIGMIEIQILSLCK